jgi:hypothetical protein
VQIDVIELRIQDGIILGVESRGKVLQEMRKGTNKRHTLNEGLEKMEEATGVTWPQV